MAKTELGEGIGARVLRKEDARHLRGRGQFVGDIRIPGMREIAFVRSPVAHAMIRERTKPPGFEDSVFFNQDMDGVLPITTRSSIPGYKVSDYPALATDRVRFVGEIVAMCVATNRAAAEDICDLVEIRYEELDPIVNCAAGRAPVVTPLHEGWTDNLFLRTSFDQGMDEVIAKAPVTVELELSTSRQVMHPMEGKGLVAWWDHRAGQLVVQTSTQVPHMIRIGLAECLGIPQATIRVAAPDVGGGFGYKCMLMPEEVAVAWLACTKKGAFRWIEDRESISRLARTPVNTNTSSRPIAMSGAGCLASRQISASIVAHIPYGRSQPVLKRPKLGETCLVHTTFKPIAAARSP